MSGGLSYQGYSARIEFDAEAECFVGRIAGIKDAVQFQGKSVTALKGAFREAVIDYLGTCQMIGQEPQKPYSGNLMLRLKPEIHAAVATAAQLSGKSINLWAQDVLDRATNN